MNGYKVKVYVSNDPKDSANGRVFHFPIIPRIGDFIDVTYKPDEINHPLVSHSGAYTVKRVWIKEVDKPIDAVLHVEVEEETK